jgi:hypothetical protein
MVNVTRIMRLFGWHILVSLGLFQLISSHRIVFIVPAEQPQFSELIIYHFSTIFVGGSVGGLPEKFG